MLVFQFGARNFYYGFIHYFFRYVEYKNAMQILIISELFFLFIFCIAISQRVFKSQIKVWIFMIQNFIKILLLLTLYFDYEKQNLISI